MERKWEYKTVEFRTHGFSGGKVDSEDIQATLNQYGAKGWELVSVAPIATAYGQTRSVLATFKRPLT